MDDEQFEDVTRLADQLERIGDAGFAVRMTCQFSGKHSGPIADEEPQTFDASSLAWQLRQLVSKVRDQQGFQSVVRGIFRGDE